MLLEATKFWSNWLCDDRELRQKAFSFLARGPCNVASPGKPSDIFTLWPFIRKELSLPVGSSSAKPSPGFYLTPGPRLEIQTGWTT